MVEDLMVPGEQRKSLKIQSPGTPFQGILSGVFAFLLVVVIKILES